MIIKIFDAGSYIQLQNVLSVVKVVDGGVIFTVPGPKGDEGDPGQGIPVGSMNGQIIRKAGSGDYETEWFTPGSIINKSFWQGTQAEYDAIVTKDPNTLYFIV